MSYKTYLEATPAEVAANAMVRLIHQTNYLLDWRQIRSRGKEFLREGGFTERLHRERTRFRRERG